MARNSHIQFFKEGVSMRLLHQEGLKKWIRNACRAYNTEAASVNFIFCSDKYLLALNKQYLGHHYLTDIITFDNSISESARLEGDIFISIDRVAANAKKFDVAFNDELHRVMIHGVLHLLGHDDKKAPDAKAMRKAEEEWLAKRFFLTRNRRR